MKQKIIPIEGMHCRSCEIMIKEKLEELKGVTSAKVSLKTESAIINASQLPSDGEIARAVNRAGYKVAGLRVDDVRAPFIANDSSVYRDIMIGVALSVAIAIIFAMSNFDVTNLTTDSSSLAVTGLLIGLTAGISTCMALVGGLVLAISAKHAEQYPSASVSQRFRPHIFFNAGRIVGFALLGALIGGLGSIFQLSGSVLGWLMIIVSFVMILLGLNLSGLFPRLNSVTLPSWLSEKLGITNKSKGEYQWYRATAVGALTFFLPCGFTQAMQLMAVGTGSPLLGAVIMGTFAVGTAPGLIGIGWLTSVVKGAFAKSFFRIVGVGVIALALVNLSGALTLVQIKFPDFSNTSSKVTMISEDTVRLDTVFTPGPDPDISPKNFTVKVGQKAALVVDVTGDGVGCMSTIMIPGLYDKPLFLKKGEDLVLEFTATQPGVYPITCAMGVKRGEIVVEG